MKIEDISDTLGALALQGPSARVILQKAADGDIDGLKYFRMTEATIRGMKVTVSRTGYTGDLGYEIWVPKGAGYKKSHPGAVSFVQRFGSSLNSTCICTP